MICYTLLNCYIYGAIFGVIDVDAAPVPEEIQEGEEETPMIPPRLEEWTVKDGI